MPIKKSTANPKKEEQQFKERLNVVVDLLSWDVESELQYSHSGSPYSRLHLSKDNAYKYSAVAFGEFAEQLAKGDFKGNTLVLTLEYDKDMGGKIKGLLMVARPEFQV